MGQALGVFAKNENTILNEVPIYAEEESHYSLANIFLNPKDYVSSILQKSTLDEAGKKWLELNDDEVKALLFNNVQDFADDVIANKNSITKPIPKNFRAIKMKYEPSKEAIVYSPEYSEFENWSGINTSLDAISKIKHVLYEDLKLSIQNGEDEDYKKYSYNNILMLFSIIRTFKRKEGADEIALIYAPN